MRYAHLPELGRPVPPIKVELTPNRSSRRGRPTLEIWIHRWGGGTFPNVVRYLRTKHADPDENVSAHLVYAGRAPHDPHARELAQLVPWSEKAWTECDFNGTGISIESADAIWLGHDPDGFAELARMTALLCKLHDFPYRYVRELGLLQGVRGFTRHADGHARGCGHLFCPTADLELWGQFVERVKLEGRHGGFRRSWGRS